MIIPERVIAISPERVIGMPRNTDRLRPESPTIGIMEIGLELHPVVRIQIFYQRQSKNHLRRVVGIVSLFGAKVMSLILSSLDCHRSWSQTVAGICTDRGQELV